jgi:hypothetical protein
MCGHIPAARKNVARTAHPYWPRMPADARTVQRSAAEAHESVQTHSPDGVGRVPKPATCELVPRDRPSARRWAIAPAFSCCVWESQGKRHIQSKTDLKRQRWWLWVFLAGLKLLQYKSMEFFLYACSHTYTDRKSKVSSWCLPFSELSPVILIPGLIIVRGHGFLWILIAHSST